MVGFGRGLGARDRRPLRARPAVVRGGGPHGFPHPVLSPPASRAVGSVRRICCALAHSPRVLGNTADVTVCGGGCRREHLCAHYNYATRHGRTHLRDSSRGATRAALPRHRTGRYPVAQPIPVGLLGRWLTYVATAVASAYFLAACLRPVASAVASTYSFFGVFSGHRAL